MSGVDQTLLSVSFLSRVLGRPVRSLRSVDRLGADRGYAGVVLRLVVEPLHGGPTTVVAKAGGGGDGGALEREVVFYRDVAGPVRAPAPRCRYAGRTPAGTPVVIMDEVSDAVAGDALAGAGPGEVEAVLAAMAAVWGHGDRPPARTLPGLPADPAAIAQRQDRYARQWRQVGQAVHDRLPDPVRRMGERLCTGLAPVLAGLAATAPTVVHADLHLDNVLFAVGDAAAPVTVVDWASACLAPVALDLFPFLATALSPADQRRHAERLIGKVARQDGGTDTGPLVRAGRLALARHFAGVIGWHSRPPSGHEREAALRSAALDDGRLVHALVQWNVPELIAEMGAGQLSAPPGE